MRLRLLFLVWRVARPRRMTARESKREQGQPAISRQVIRVGPTGP